ncbi:MAG: phosphonopyruvate decarboxylase [Lachnospiraceae bacterium]|jgi:phosphonopyruvate decarboxylase
MIDIGKFIEQLQENGVGFFTGVPDSYLNDFCNTLLEMVPDERNVIAANEGNAIALAAGYYFGEDTIPLVYMQNSGLGNCVNPLVSLADVNVYSVPMILLIGWRGPGEPNHPQHKLQGEITPRLLEDMNIPYMIVNEENAFEAGAWAAKLAAKESRPVGLIARKGVFNAKIKINTADDVYPMSREEAIAAILDAAPADAVFTATTGRAARELHALREQRGEGHERDFLNVGAMGHNSSVALGIALACPDRPVICLDGDASAIMHMGSMTTDAKVGAGNYIRVILNNGVHESVGGQPSAGYFADFTAIAKGCGYKTLDGPVDNKTELKAAIEKLTREQGPAFLDVRIHKGIRPDMPALAVDHADLIDKLKKELR